jgi:1,3-beta-glucan synthase
VWRYAVLYFVLFIIFMALAIGPVVASSKLYGVVDKLNSIGLLSAEGLVQPYNQSNNDTSNYKVTGTGIAAAGTGAAATGSGGAGAAASTGSAGTTPRIVKLF